MKLKRLIKIVSLLDKDAAEYIKLYNEYPAGYKGDDCTLSVCFVWSSSPQGLEYWSNINAYVKHIEDTIELYKDE